MKIIFLNSHPIQYFTPLYQYLGNKELDFEVWYCSDASVKGEIDKGFGAKVKWDLPMLAGYNYRFFKNLGRKTPSEAGIWGILNPGLIKALFKEPRSIIVIPGWQFGSYILAAVVGRIAGHTIAMRCEMPLKQDLLKKGLLQRLKRFLLKYFYFPIFHHCLYIGKQNQAFYEAMGVKAEKLYFTPYAVDNERFHQSYLELQSSKESIRKKLGLFGQDKVILYSGKYIDKKRPMDLLQAFADIDHPDKSLIMVGDGELRHSMETFIREKKLNKVILTGFINQSEISRFYSIADIFVMCSDIGETWGLSVNEAMNFALPVIVSDICGCSEDLVNNGRNGFVFRQGNIDELAYKIKFVMADEKFRKSAGEQSAAIVKAYSFEAIHKSLKQLVDNVGQNNALSAYSSSYKG